MLEKASEKDLIDIKNKWSEEANDYGDDGSVYANDIRLVVDNLINQIEEKDHYAYFLKKQDGEITAILHIIHALPNSDKPWLKLFDLEISPHIAFFDHDDKLVGETVTASIFEPVDLLFGDYAEAKELKIYSRTELMGDLFTFIAKDKGLKEILSKSEISCLKQNQWLVFRKK